MQKNFRHSLTKQKTVTTLLFPGYQNQTPGMSFEFPFEYAIAGEFGRLFYPIVQLQLKTIAGWKTFEFLVDTGADITTVSTSLLPILGITQSTLRLSTTFGVGGFSVKTWNFSLPIRIGTYELSIAASAVEISGDSMPFLLGRKDIFEDHWNLLIDSKRKVTVLSENK